MPQNEIRTKSGVYESVDEYLDTLIRLWIAMTFVDGHAALAPPCRARGQSGPCGNALWTVSASSSGLRCRTQHCSGSVEFSCRIKSHDSLCSECAMQSFTNHRGGPGPNASTNVYDCDVARIPSDGVVYLKGVISRKPPLAPIHWRTTKRLSQHNLVGIVRLQASGAALLETDPIT